MSGGTSDALPATNVEAGEPRLSASLNALGLIGFYAALLVAWQVLVPLLQVPSYVVPVPSEIIGALARGIASGQYLRDLAVTLMEMLIGFGVATVVGILMGALIVEIRIVERLIYPLIVAIQSLPKIALAPLLLIWIGFGLASKVALAALIAFFPILVNTATGLRSCDRDMYQLFDSLQASRLQALWHLKLPAAAPYIIAGLDVGFVFALLGAIVGEFLGASAGLGYAILQLQFQMDTAGVFAILVLLAAIGISGHTAIRAIGRKVAFWQASVIASR